MALTLVALAVGAGLIFLLTTPASAGAAPVYVPPAPVPTTQTPILRPSTGIGSSTLPNATTAITAGVVALLTWAITSLTDNSWDEFARQLGFRDESALDLGLQAIGRDDLIRIKSEIKAIMRKSSSTPPVLGMPTGTSAEKVAVFRAWKEMVIAAFEQAGYVFPA